jgi:hypothetical protein
MKCLEEDIAKKIFSDLQVRSMLRLMDNDYRQYQRNRELILSGEKYNTCIEILDSEIKR